MKEDSANISGARISGADTLLLARQKYSRKDVVTCTDPTCRRTLMIRDLTITEGGECKCPGCGNVKFRFTVDSEAQRIRTQCIVDYIEKKDPFSGTAEFTVRLQDRKVSLIVGGKVIVQRTDVSYESLYDKIEAQLSDR